VQVGSQARADRYTYLPQIGLCIAVAWSVAGLAAAGTARRWTCGAVSAVVIAVLMGCAWRQTTFWRDSETMWRHTLACTSGNDVAHYNLAGTLDRLGRTGEAIAEYREALDINQVNPDIPYNLAYALQRQGKQGQIDEAITYYERAVELDPNYVQVHNNLGALLRQKGQFDRAIMHYEQALRAEPGHFAAEFNLGNVLFQAGRFREAKFHYQQALELAPADHPRAREIPARIAECDALLPQNP
jgi:protein O-mannosyl-transferase